MLKTMEPLTTVEIADAQLERISALVKALSGIHLDSGKKDLVKARLNKRLRSLGMRSFDDYIEYVERDPDAESTAMLDAISTNLTSFFRESNHFDYLADCVLPGVVATGRRRLRIWSAGCSTGEEPYSIAITLLETLPDLAGWDARILATDLSTDVLKRARSAMYDQRRLDTMDPRLRKKYFLSENARRGGDFVVADSVRNLVTFAHLNLMGQWPMRGPFDVIFCRNVMIYFDKPTRATLVQRFWDLLGPGGTLLIGHSESLTGIEHRFRYVQPTIYSKT
jgi:chemotaxis protein methyltransferase CheR